MAGAVDRTEGWYLGRRSGTSEWTGGPYTWEQLVAYTLEGRVLATDLVWHSTITGWTPADRIPGLPVRAIAPTPKAFRAHKRTGLAVTAAVLGGALVLAAIGGGAYLFIGSKGSHRADLGAASFTPPDPTSVVVTPEWGAIPTDYIGIMMKDGSGRPQAEKAASAMGGKVVGEVEFASIYQVSIPPKGAEGVKAALALAAQQPGVESAFPDQLTMLDAEAAGSVEGTQCTPLNEPPYLPTAVVDNGLPYRMIGVQNAWDIVRGSGVKLTPVKVAVLDTPLLRSTGEFDGATVVETPEAEDSTLTASMAAGKPEPLGTHGTAVTSIIGADPDNGGVAGVASVLGDTLSIRHTNVFADQYGSVVVTAALDPANLTQAPARGGTWSIGELVAMTRAIKSDATLVSCSWGRSDSSESMTKAYRRFFARAEAKRSDVLFVCSAGNDGKSLDGMKRTPSGVASANMVTVGNLENDGTRRSSSNMIGPDFEVTLAAPGHRVLSGVAADGSQSNVSGGTSFATPQVTATAAMMRALNPMLSAGDIKRILVETGRPAVSDDAKKLSRPVDPTVGGRVLASDLAVLRVLNDLRQNKGKPQLTLEQAVARGRIALVAQPSSAGSWRLSGALDPSVEGGHELTISGVGQQGITGSATQKAQPGKPVTWGVSATNAATIHVKRPDNGACSRVGVGGSLVGDWKGTRTEWLPGGVLGTASEAMTISIAQIGDRYFGDITIPTANGPVTFPLGRIKLVGSTVTINMSGDGSPLSPSTFTGELNGDTITGADARDGGASQSVTLQRVK